MPKTVIGKAPDGVVPCVVIVIVEVQLGDGVQFVGAKLAFAPEGSPEVENDTASAVPTVLVTVIVDWIELPAFTLPNGGLAPSVKSKDGAVTVNV